MDKDFEEKLNKLEQSYPGISKQVLYYEQMEMPPCPYCGSEDTAMVTVGIIGRSINIAAATEKVTLVANNKPGDYRCNQCKEYFTPINKMEDDPQ